MINYFLNIVINIQIILRHSEAELAKIQGPCVQLYQFAQYVVQMNKQSNDPLRREFKVRMILLVYL